MSDFGASLKNIEDRGYALAEMRDIEEQIQAAKRAWIRAFDRFIELFCDEESSPRSVVDRAEQMADLRAAVITRHYPEGE